MEQRKDQQYFSVRFRKIGVALDVKQAFDVEQPKDMEQPKDVEQTKYRQCWYVLEEKMGVVQDVELFALRVTRRGDLEAGDLEINEN